MNELKEALKSAIQKEYPFYIHNNKIKVCIYRYLETNPQDNNTTLLKETGAMLRDSEKTPIQKHKAIRTLYDELNV